MPTHRTDIHARARELIEAYRQNRDPQLADAFYHNYYPHINKKLDIYFARYPELEPDRPKAEAIIEPQVKRIILKEHDDALTHLSSRVGLKIRLGLITFYKTAHRRQKFFDQPDRRIENDGSRRPLFTAIPETPEHALMVQDTLKALSAMKAGPEGSVQRAMMQHITAAAPDDILSENTGPAHHLDIHKLAADLGITENHAKVAAFRIRQKAQKCISPPPLGRS